MAFQSFEGSTWRISCQNAISLVGKISLKKHAFFKKNVILFCQLYDLIYLHSRKRCSIFTPSAFKISGVKMEHFPEPVRFYRYKFEKFQISEYPFQKLFLLLFVDTGVSTSYLKKLLMILMKQKSILLFYTQN